MTKITEPGVYLDPKALNSIKENPDKAEGLAKAADQFETLFLQMVLKSMRNASDALSDEDSLVSSKQQRMYRDMYDGQLTMAMINKGSIGIADAMVEQLSPAVNSGTSGTDQPLSSQSGDQLGVQPGNQPSVQQINKNESSLKSSENPVAKHEVSNESFRQSLIKINKSGAQ